MLLQKKLLKLERFKKNKKKLMLTQEQMVIVLMNIGPQICQVNILLNRRLKQKPTKRKKRKKSLRRMRRRMKNQVMMMKLMKRKRRPMMMTMVFNFIKRRVNKNKRLPRRPRSNDEKLIINFSTSISDSN